MPFCRSLSATSDLARSRQDGKLQCAVHAPPPAPAAAVADASGDHANESAHTLARRMESHVLELMKSNVDAQSPEDVIFELEPSQIVRASTVCRDIIMCVGVRRRASSSRFVGGGERRRGM